MERKKRKTTKGQVFSKKSDKTVVVIVEREIIIIPPIKISFSPSHRSAIWPRGNSNKTKGKSIIVKAKPMADQDKPI